MQLPLPTRSLAAAAIAGSLVAIGCGSKPIPLFAVAGTTFTIAIPEGFPTGYGTRLASNPDQSPPPSYDPNSLAEDPQRGELFFDLYTTTGTFVRHLPLAYITRVNMSPQSRSASAGSMLYERGQALAFVNIPYQVAAGSYHIRVIRHRRVPTSPNTYEQAPTPLTNFGGWPIAPYYGWGDDSVPSGTTSYPSRIQITIVAGDGQNHFTPLRGWAEVPPDGVLWADVSADLAGLTPYPEFDLLVPQAGSPFQKPAAWEAELTYPREMLRIRGVELRHPTRSSAIVRWQAEDPASISCESGSPDGSLKIKVIDPDQETSGVRVAYELRNFGQPCGGRAVWGTFSVSTESFKAYDLDGADIPNMNYEIPASSFF